MRRLLTGLVVVAATALVPMLAWAGNNQETAEQIRKNLCSSGQMHHFKIGVKYQSGTAWLRGQVCSEEQAKTALEIASQTPGVTRVVNNLTVSATEVPQTPAPENRVQPATGALAPEQHARSTAMSASPTASNEWLTSAAKHLQSLVKTSPQEAAPTEPAAPAETSVVIRGGAAEAVASSYTPAPVQAVTAELEQPSPQPVPVQRAARPLPVAMLAPPAAGPQQGAPARMVAMTQQPTPAMMGQPGTPLPMGAAPAGMAPVPAYAPNPGMVAPARYDQPNLPNYSWPSYAAYPNYAAVTYPRQYSPTAWPYIGPFYPYPQVPLGWRKVTMEWDDGWWFLDFKDRRTMYNH